MDDQQASDERRPVPDYRPVRKPDPGPMFTEPGQSGPTPGEGEWAGAVVPFESDPVDDRLELTDELTQSVLEAILEEESIEERLSDHRYEVVGLVRGHGKDKGDDGRPIVLVVADYSTNTTLEISVTEEEYDVTSVSENHQQAALSPAEIDRALELLNEEGPLEDALPWHTVREAFLISPSNPSHHRNRHRGVFLAFDATGTERFTHTSDATHVAEIDLSTGDLLDVREVPDVPTSEIASTAGTAGEEGVDE